MYVDDLFIEFCCSFQEYKFLVQNLRDKLHVTFLFKFLWCVLNYRHILVLYLLYEFALLRILTHAGRVIGKI